MPGKITVRDNGPLRIEGDIELCEPAALRSVHQGGNMSPYVAVAEAIISHFAMAHIPRMDSSPRSRRACCHRHRLLHRGLLNLRLPTVIEAMRPQPQRYVAAFPLASPENM